MKPTYCHLKDRKILRTSYQLPYKDCKPGTIHDQVVSTFQVLISPNLAQDHFPLFV